jgi:hypothetical protein
MVDPDLETVLFPLLDSHSVEDILFALYRYARTQVELAEMLEQPSAVAEWKQQVCALDMACEVLDNANRGGDEYFTHPVF